MRERGMKTYVLIGGKMVKFAQREKFETWFRERIESRIKNMNETEYFTAEEIMTSVGRDLEVSRLRSKITRRHS